MIGIHGRRAGFPLVDLTSHQFAMMHNQSGVLLRIDDNELEMVIVDASGIPNLTTRFTVERRLAEHQSQRRIGRTIDVTEQLPFIGPFPAASP